MPATTARRAHTRARPAPRPRRISGPIARPLPAAAPLVRRGNTGAFERLRALPDHRMVDRLLRGRAWIWLIGLMLGGIVAMQVSLLKINAGISHSVERAGTLERVNADLETEVAKLASGERIQQVAAAEGMVAPPAGEVSFLRARPSMDPRLAAERMQPPSEEAQQVMANGGRELVPVVPVTEAAPVVPEPVTTPAPDASSVPDPVLAPTTTTAPVE